MYLVVKAENYGPAAATNVIIDMRLLTPAGDAIEASKKRMREPVWGVGHHRTFMPRRSDQIEALNDLADAGLRLKLEWSWSDGRRSGWLRGGLPRQERTVTYSLRDFADDMYGGGALIEANPLDQLPKIVSNLKKLTHSVDEIPRVLDRPRTEALIRKRLAQSETETPPDE